MVDDAELLWKVTGEILVQQVSDAVWLTTFNDVGAIGLHDGLLTISVPSVLVKDRIESRYRELVTSALADAGQPGLDLHIEVNPAPGITDDAELLEAELKRINESVGPASDDLLQGAVVNANSPVLNSTAVDLTPTESNPKYTFEAFVTGPSNRFAQAAALSVAETPARSYNPLFIYGDAGLGKTHLLQAIAHYVDENYPNYKVRYISTEAFMNQFVDAIRTNALPAFKRRYREIDVLLVDDIQFMEGKEGLQEEFFHTFNTLHEANRQIVLSSDRPPDSISTLEDRLRTRFKMGLITDIQPPDLETRLAILRKKAEHEKTPIPDGVLDFIVTHITNNIRELEGALIRVAAYANLTKEDLSVDVAEHVLGDLLTDDEPRRITPDNILDATATKYNFSVEELRGKSRRRPLVIARQVGMYVFRELTDLSYPQIAREFGGRDHTTVIHAYDKISSLMKERRAIYDDVTSLIQEIKSVG
ncbi:MAG: chromosomal replication initiator protein DnaA [Actinobacteria bacterium]|nr:MAG: chromosomal replication initiator protein DnaA [Actinomycetota bacterium]RIK04898.1 MAG: chromosomal replication initiator protein DnaA [Acidobacteriota bacterium]